MKMFVKSEDVCKWSALFQFKIAKKASVNTWSLWVYL